MIVHRLTIEQKELLTGKLFAKDSYFSPTQDVNGQWFISVEEVEQCINEEFMWVKSLPLINFKPLLEDTI